MNIRTILPRLITGGILAVFMGLSLYFRIHYPYDDIFVGDWIKFSSNDAYFHMRMVDSIVRNFPHALSFDPYLMYPGGAWISSINFFDWLLAGIIWVIGLGSPSQYTIDLIGAYYPVALAALTVIPVYFIGKHVFSRWVGLLAAALIAILPGEFLGRSILAFTDNHVAETLFSATAMLFLALAVKSGSQGQLSLEKLKQRQVPTRTIVYTLLAGLFLGTYLITWAGGLLFVFIIAVYLIVQYVIDHLSGRPTDYLAIIGGLTLLVAGIIFVPRAPVAFYVVALAAALSAPILLTVISKWMSAKGLRRGYYPLALVAVGGAAVGILFLVAPTLATTMFEQFAIFWPTGPSTTTLEMQPLLSAGATLPIGNFPGLSTVLASWPDGWQKLFVVADILFIFAFMLVLVFHLARTHGPWYAYLNWTMPAFLGILSFMGVSNLWLLVTILAIFLGTLIALRFDKDFSDGFGFYVAWSVAVMVGLLALSGLSPVETTFTAKSLGVLLTSEFFFSIIGLVVLILTVRKTSPDRNLLLVWSLITFAAVLGQRRFAYYFAVNVALLTAFISWEFISKSGLGTLLVRRAKPVAVAETKPASKKSRHQPKRPVEAEGRTSAYSMTAIAFAVVFFFVFFANFKAAEATARSARFAPSDAWYSSMLWLKDNTPDPFDTPNFYSQRYPPAGSFTYPPTAYGVTAWWDYGYWISRIGQRLPSVNPSQPPDQIRSVAGLFLAQNEADASAIMQKLQSSYVVIDNQTTTSKYWAIVRWAERPLTDYMEEYYLAQNKRFVWAYYPGYYRSLAVRLYNFDGKAVAPRPGSIIVIGWEPRQSGSRNYKEITSLKTDFADWESAVAYANSQKSGNYRVVGSNAFASPMRLEALKDYSLAYGSTNTIVQQDVGGVPEVKIFRYAGGPASARR